MQKQFNDKKYLCLETFRKNGQGVKTPVWFAQDGAAIFVWTFAGAGKIKRIRRNGFVRIAPSNASGSPLGDWVDALASADHSLDAIKHVEILMRNKYGIQFLIFNALGRVRKSQTEVIKITFS